MIKVRKNPVICTFFSAYHARLLKKHFYAVHLKNEEIFKRIEKTMPVILYANHSNWWDGFIAFQLSSKYLKADDYLMMDIDQMNKYRFFKYVGVFSVDRKNARQGVESVNYAVELLKNTSRYLWIFPQGEMKPQDYEQVKFYTGVTRIAQKLGSVNLIPVAIRYEFIKEQRPEVFIKIGEPDANANNITDTKAYTVHLRDKLWCLLAELKNEIISGETTGYKKIFSGKPSRNKTIDRIYE